MTEPDLAPKAIDWQKCLQLANQNAEIARLALAAFIDDLRENLALAQQSFINQDITGLRGYIHKLHGGSYYCGVPQLSQCLAELDKQLSLNNIKILHLLMIPLENEAQRIFTAYAEQRYEDQS